MPACCAYGAIAGEAYFQGVAGERFAVRNSGAIAVVEGDVVVLREICCHVVQLPVLGVQFRQLLGRNRLPEKFARFGERRAGPRADGAPAVVVKRAVAHHLEVLRDVFGWGLRVTEGVGEADAFNRRLGDAANGGGRLDAQQIEHSGHHVDGVGVLRADFAFRLDAFRPLDDEGIAGAAAIGFALPAAERRVSRPGPAPGVMVVGGGSAKLVDGFQVVLERFGNVVEEEIFVDRSGRPAFGTGAVVGKHHDQRVVELADPLEEIEQGEARREARRARGRQHVVRPGDVIADQRKAQTEDKHQQKSAEPVHASCNFSLRQAGC